MKNIHNLSPSINSEHGQFLEAYKQTRKLVNVDDAMLPKFYEKAKHALAVSYDIDECKDWRDKAAALAAYARIANDKTLSNYARQIEGRAELRMQELLPECLGEGGDKRSLAGSTSGPRTAALGRHGISPHQDRVLRGIGRMERQEPGVFAQRLESNDFTKRTELVNYGRTSPLTHPLATPDYDKDGKLIATLQKARELNA